MSGPASWSPIQKIAFFINTKLQWPIIYTSMIVGFPSLLLYFSECWVILRHRQFHNPFYALFVVRSFQDILLLVCSYLLHRLPTIMRSPFLLSLYRLCPNSLLVGIFVLLYFGMESGNLATTFMLLNRLTAIIFPFGQKKIWQKLLPISLLIILGLPMYFGRYFFGMQTGFYINAADNNFIVIENNQEKMTTFLQHDFFIVFIASIANLVLCTLINVTILIAYSKRRNAPAIGKGQKQAAGGGNGIPKNIQQEQQNQQQRRTENKLIVYAICTFASHMLFTLLMVGNFLASEAKDYLTMGGLQSISPLSNDLGCIVMPSGLLLWASPEFRRKWCRCFMPKCLLKYMGTTSSTTSHKNVIHVVSLVQQK